MARTWSWILLGIMVVMLAGCGRTPTAAEGTGKKKPAPVHTRSATLPSVH
jgi:hypothetical protein